MDTEQQKQLLAALEYYKQVWAERERDVLECEQRLGNCKTWRDAAYGEIERLTMELSSITQKSEPTQVESDNVKSNVSEASAEADVTAKTTVTE